MQSAVKDVGLCCDKVTAGFSGRALTRAFARYVAEEQTAHARPELHFLWLSGCFLGLGFQQHPTPNPKNIQPRKTSASLKKHRGRDIF